MGNLDRILLRLDCNWPKLDAIRKKYGPEVEIDDTGRPALALLYSNSDEFTIADLVREYKLGPLDDHLQRSAARCRRQS